MMPAVRIFRDRKEVVRRMDLKKLNSTFRIFRDRKRLPHPNVSSVPFDDHLSPSGAFQISTWFTVCLHFYFLFLDINSGFAP